MQTNQIEKQKDKILIEQIICSLLLRSPVLRNVGIMHGKMGEVILLEHYARYSSNSFYCDLSGELIDQIYDNITYLLPLSFESGLCGIGWGIEYLLQNNFMKLGNDNTLELIDQRVMETDPERITDVSLRTGLGGILQYVNSRLKSQHTHMFDLSYLNSLKLAVYNIINIAEAGKCVNAALNFLKYMDTGEWDESSININDLCHLPEFLDTGRTNSFDLEKGCLGLALNKII